MAQVCTVCKHSKQAEINKLLVSSNTSLRDIAQQYSVSHSALHRHKQEHIPDSLLRAVEREDVRQALDVIQQLKAINNASLRVLQEARTLGAHELQLKAIDRLYRQIELQAKLIGQLDERPVFNVLISPQWITVRAVIMDALQEFPAARTAVACKLLELEEGKNG